MHSARRMEMVGRTGGKDEIGLRRQPGGGGYLDETRDRPHAHAQKEKTQALRHLILHRAPFRKSGITFSLMDPNISSEDKE
jgi:hypothetical protein